MNTVAGRSDGYIGFRIILNGGHSFIILRYRYVNVSIRYLDAEKTVETGELTIDAAIDFIKTRIANTLPGSSKVNWPEIDDEDDMGFDLFG